MDMETLALARNYTKKTAVGLGAVKGAPCTVSSVEEEDGAHTVTFKWTGSDGTTQTQKIKVLEGDGGSLEDDVKSNITIGSIKSGQTLTSGLTFTEFVKMLLTVHTNPSIKITLSDTIAKIGDTITVTVTTTATDGSGSINSVIVNAGNSEILNKSASGTYTTSYTAKNTTVFSGTVTDSDGYDGSTTATLNFVSPYYYGESELDDGSDFETLTEDVCTKTSAKKIIMDFNNKHCVFAYPKSYGKLTSIKDTMFENINAFNVFELTHSNGTEYYVYVSDGLYSSEDFEYTFYL